MSTVVTFTPLLGARTDAPPCCHLLEVGGCTLLLDCGWDLAFAPEALAALAEVAPRVDAVLLSHAGVAHVGATNMANFFWAQVRTNRKHHISLPHVYFPH